MDLFASDWERSFIWNGSNDTKSTYDVASLVLAIWLLSPRWPWNHSPLSSLVARYRTEPSLSLEEFSCIWDFFSSDLDAVLFLLNADLIVSLRCGFEMFWICTAGTGNGLATSLAKSFQPRINEARVWNMQNKGHSHACTERTLHGGGISTRKHSVFTCANLSCTQRISRWCNVWFAISHCHCDST